MTTHAAMARVPFAPLDNPRLQHLASAKNRQNGMAALSPLSGKAAKGALSPPSKSTLSAPKRPFESSAFDDVVDCENVDPALFSSPAKKSKSDVSSPPAKPFTFTATPPAKSMPPPPSVPARLSTPIRANMSSPRTPLTAPAGRSPKRRAAGIGKTRRVSAPFTRIDPPFSSRGGASGSSGSASLPFSLDAALSGTLSGAGTAAAAAACAPKSSTGATIQESMPKNWFFDIYEDSPEEEAATLMEHSTLTLDLSSDEESSRRAKDDRGKENTPPDDYDARAASRPAGEPTHGAPRHVKKTDIVRKKLVVAVDAMDDGQRSPLSDLETDPFIPEGLDKDSHVIVHPTPEKAPSTIDTHDQLFAAPVPFMAGANVSSKRKAVGVTDVPVVNARGDVKGEIIVWEDSPSVNSTDALPLTQSFDKGTVADENAARADDEVA